MFLEMAFDALHAEWDERIPVVLLVEIVGQLGGGEGEREGRGVEKKSEVKIHGER